MKVLGKRLITFGLKETSTTFENFIPQMTVGSLRVSSYYIVTSNIFVVICTGVSDLHSCFKFAMVLDCNMKTTLLFGQSELKLSIFSSVLLEMKFKYTAIGQKIPNFHYFAAMVWQELPKCSILYCCQIVTIIQVINSK